MKGPPKSTDKKPPYDPKLDYNFARKKDKSLPAGYVPRDDDVICGRGKDCSDHIGNVKFRALVKEKLNRYANAANKTEKSLIIMETINEVRLVGRFIRKETGLASFIDAGDFIAVRHYYLYYPVFNNCSFTLLIFFGIFINTL
jgi:hypothetical protein